MHSVAELVQREQGVFPSHLRCLPRYCIAGISTPSFLKGSRYNSAMLTPRSKPTGDLATIRVVLDRSGGYLGFHDKKDKK